MNNQTNTQAKKGLPALNLDRLIGSSEEASSSIPRVSATNKPGKPSLSLNLGKLSRGPGEGSQKSNEVINSNNNNNNGSNQRESQRNQCDKNSSNNNNNMNSNACPSAHTLSTNYEDLLNENIFYY